MRIFLFLILVYAPLCEGVFSWLAVMRLVSDAIQKLISSFSKDPPTKTKMYCRELAQFTPQLCDNAVASEKCTEICGEDKTLPGKRNTYLGYNFSSAARWTENITCSKCFTRSRTFSCFLRFRQM